MEDRVVLRERWVILVAGPEGLSAVGWENGYGACLSYVRQHYWKLCDNPKMHDDEGGSRDIECSIRKARTIAGPVSQDAGDTEIDHPVGWACLAKDEDGNYGLLFEPKVSRAAAELSIIQGRKELGENMPDVGVASVREVIVRRADG